MNFKMRLYREKDDKPVCEPFDIYADDVEEARELAWDEYIGKYGLLLEINKDNAGHDLAEDDGTHGGRRMFQFLLIDNAGERIDLGEPITVWASDEGYAREYAWDTIEYLLYADPDHDRLRHLGSQSHSERSDAR